MFQNRKPPPGKACGYAPVERRSLGFCSLPDAGIAKIPSPPLKKRIVPSSDQEPDIGSGGPPVPVLPINVGAPPAASTRNSPPPTKYATVLLSGDQKGRWAKLAPSTIRGAALPVRG